MGRGVSESRDSNSVREYASTRVRHVLTYQCTDVLNPLLWSWELYLKDHCPYLDSSYFVVNLRIQKELTCWAKYSTSQKCHCLVLSIYLAHCQHQPEVSPLGVITYTIVLKYTLDIFSIYLL